MNFLLPILSPPLVLSTLLSLTWATAWFVWRGGGWQDWAVDFLAALLGFGAGQLLGGLVDAQLPTVGEVRVVEGSLLCWLSLWLVRRRRTP